MATRQELLAEASRRGLLSPQQQAAFDEAQRRGLLGAEPTQLPLISPTVEVAPQLTPTALPPVVAEAAGGLTRGVAAIPDFFIDAANTLVNAVNENPALAAAGSAILEPIFGAREDIGQIPRVQETLEDVTGGAFGARDFMEPGLARTVVQEGGEFVPAMATLVTAGRQVATRTAQELSEAAAREAARVSGFQRVGDTRAVRQTISEAGEVVTDPSARAAIRQGFGEGVIAQVKAASKKTKERMRRMVKTTQQGLTNEAFAAKNRPADVAGETVANRIAGIARVNKRAGAGINREAKKLANQRADFSPASTRFLDDLEEIGVSVGDDLKVNLRGSDIEDIAGAEKMLNTVLRRLSDVGDNALQGHRLKRFIDEQVSFGKRGKEGLSGTVERVLKGLRRNVDGVLDDAFPAYRKENEIFAETREVLDLFQDAAGKSINLESANVAKQIGTLSRRLFSNVQSRVKLLDAVEGLDTVAAKHGIDVSDDVVALARFADELDNVFKPAARTSLRAEVAKAGVTEGRAGVTRKLAERGVERLMRINDQEALKAIKAVLAP